MLKEYKKVEENVRDVFGSKIRTIVLLSLLEREKSLKELEKSVGYSAGTIYHRLKELKKSKLVKKNGMIYTLTPLGKISAIKTEKIVKYFSVLKRFEKFFETHDVGAIPENFLEKIYMLYNSELFTEDVDPLIPIKVLSEIFERAETICGVTSVGTYEWAEIFKKKKKISIVATKDVFSKIKNKASYLLEKKDFEIRVYDVKFLLVLTDKDFCLALRKGESLDMQNMILSKDKEALKWGKELFSELFSRASPYK